MKLEDLMSGIGVVIDDALEDGEDGLSDDPITHIMKAIGAKWNLPFYTAKKMPREAEWPGLLEAASFILLDWQLWPAGAAHLEAAGVEKNVRFLDKAKSYCVPVFVFTNENTVDVIDKLPTTIYARTSPEKNFVFVHNKGDLLSGDSVDFSSIERWIRQNASVYALKTWYRVFHSARRELFAAMYARNPDWPRVFWEAAKLDGVDASWSLTHLIKDSLWGRMRTDAFERDVLEGSEGSVPKEDVRAVIGEASVRPQQTLPDGEVGCGDMFRLPRKKFMLNLRPECDCVPREGQGVDEVELYCVEGKAMSDKELDEQYQGGGFVERTWEGVAFAVHEGRSVRFNFKTLHVKKFGELKSARVGRLLHPYLTRIQQRFGLYLQRQALPRIPEGAVRMP